MKGAIAVPPEKTIIRPIRSNTTMTGNSHHFFLAFRNFRISIMDFIGFWFLMDLNSVNQV
jgi:hypothetical protein